jgi:hypothetical protein
MFASLFGSVRDDVDRQIQWARAEVRRQTRHTALTLILAGMATAAGLGAAAVGLIALYIWLAVRYGQFLSLGAIGGGLLLLALVLFVLAFTRRRLPVASPPPLQVAQPSELLRTLAGESNGQLVAGSQQALNLAATTMRDGSRSALFGTLVLAALIGLIAGRRAGGGSHRL